MTATGKLHVRRAEMVLIHNDLHPLGEPPMKPEPLWRFARISPRLDTNAGESFSVVVDLLPLTPRERLRHRRRLARRAQREVRGRGGLFDGGGLGEVIGLNSKAIDQALFGSFVDAPSGGNGSGGQSKTEADLEERRWEDSLRKRLESLETAFRLQVLIKTTSPDKQRAELFRDTLVSCFDQFNGPNAFQVHGLNIGFAFLGADTPLLRWHFDRRFRSGLFRPVKRSVVSAKEVTAFLKPPTDDPEPENLVFRLTGAIPPFELPTFSYQPDLLPLGRVFSRDGIKMIGTRVEDARLSYTAGRARSGKTELAMNQFIHLARSGYGCLFLDPNPEKLEQLRPYLTDVADRIVEINLSDQGAGLDLGWNLLSMEGRTIQHIELKTRAVVEAFASAMNAGQFELHDRMFAYLTVAVQSLLELGMRLPANLAPTIFQVASLLGDPGWRQAAIPYLSSKLRGFWERFGAMSDMYSAEVVCAPLINLLARLRSWPGAARRLGAIGSTYDIQRCMDEGKIVLACSGGRGEKERLIANLLFYEMVYTALLTRQNLLPERRQPFYAFVDELATYDGANIFGQTRVGTGKLGDLLEQVSRYRLYPFLQNTNPDRLTELTRQAIINTRTSLASMILDERGAQLIAKEWGTSLGNPPNPLWITLLDRYTYLTSVMIDRLHTLAFLVHGVAVKDMWSHCRDGAGVPGLKQRIDDNVRALGGQRLLRSTAELNTLDERIRRWLDDHRREVAPPARAARPSAHGPDRPEEGG